MAIGRPPDERGPFLGTEQIIKRLRDAQASQWPGQVRALAVRAAGLGALVLVGTMGLLALRAARDGQFRSAASLAANGFGQAAPEGAPPLLASYTGGEATADGPEADAQAQAGGDASAAAPYGGDRGDGDTDTDTDTDEPERSGRWSPAGDGKQVSVRAHSARRAARDEGSDDGDDSDDQAGDRGSASGPSRAIRGSHGTEPSETVRGPSSRGRKPNRVSEGNDGRAQASTSAAKRGRASSPTASRQAPAASGQAPGRRARGRADAAAQGDGDPIANGEAGAPLGQGVVRIIINNRKGTLFVDGRRLGMEQNLDVPLAYGSHYVQVRMAGRTMTYRLQLKTANVTLTFDDVRDEIREEAWRPQRREL